MPTITCSLATPVSRVIADRVELRTRSIFMRRRSRSLVPRREDPADLRAVVRSELRDRRPHGAPDDRPQRQRLLDRRDVRRAAVPRPQRLERRMSRQLVERVRRPVAPQVLEQGERQAGLDDGQAGRERASRRRAGRTAPTDSASPQIQSSRGPFVTRSANRTGSGTAYLTATTLGAAATSARRSSAPDGRVADVGHDRQPGDGLGELRRGSGATPPAIGRVRRARGP